MIQGIYEELVTQLVKDQLQQLDQQTFYINTTPVDKEEAATLLAKHLALTIRRALTLVRGDQQIERQIHIANKIILVLKEELQREEFTRDIIAAEGQILNAVFSRVDAHFADFDLHLKEIIPYTRLTHSELFTGGNVGLSLESEIKKEILSADQIDLLVSFIKFKGVIILKKELEEFTQRGGQLRVITSTYMGASDYKAILMLSKLPNTLVKVSYNNRNERLHAKAYLFKRHTGFDTAYIGSSNFSRSALTDGLEWNLKITTKEISHIIEKCKKTFETYWQNNDFELFTETADRERLLNALQQGRNNPAAIHPTTFFDITPHPFQREILEKLQVERLTHGRYRNLVVAATGTGKTVISAFDFLAFRKENPQARFLFVAHRKEILLQAMHTYRGVLRDNSFGEIWVDGHEPKHHHQLFASIQTLNNRLDGLFLTPGFYDYIVFDECHHLPADSYRKTLDYFRPKILLGLTATPERMDDGDILPDFDGHIAAEIRLPEALNLKLLCPFQYFGITDSIDLRQVSWERGRYVPSELTAIYTANDRRVREVIDALSLYTKDLHEVRAVGFCVSIEHARYMAEKFCLAGLKASSLTSTDTDRRSIVRQQLVNKEINYLFVVDIYNEGVDIPEIDTVLFLRPTESLTVFLQQLGRGLRLHEGKDCLTVLDFVGNARPEYRFENKFRALIGKTASSVAREVEDNFPHLPLGCSIVLEKKAKEIILDNIQAATRWTTAQLIQKIQGFSKQSDLSLNLNNWLTIHPTPLPILYKRGGWKRLCQQAGKIADFNDPNEKQILTGIRKKWLSTQSYSYFTYIRDIARRGFDIQLSECTPNEQRLLLMLHYDIWGVAGGFEDLADSIRAIGKNPVMVEEMIELLDILIDRIDFQEMDIELPYPLPLKVHARYTRDQILAAFQHSTFDSKEINMVGVLNLPNLNTELLFINLVKSEKYFSPTTMYDDYAISETLFHWQSQNSAGPHTSAGKSYLTHEQQGKLILLFVRESNRDEYGNTPGFVFLGKGRLVSSTGSQPMSITWELSVPIPNYLWSEAAKLRVG